MTDRTPASPVEVLTVEQALREAIDYARLSPNGERRKRWEAALQAQDHTITKGGLDVEMTPQELDLLLIERTPLLRDAYVAYVLRRIESEAAPVKFVYPSDYCGEPTHRPPDFATYAQGVFRAYVDQLRAALEPTHD